MADETQIPDTQPANHREIAQQQAAGLFDLVPLDKLQLLLTNAIQEGGANVIGAAMKASIDILAFVTKTIAEGEDRSSGELARLLEIAVKDLLNIDVSVRPVRLTGGPKVGGGGDTAMGGAVLEALTRGGASTEPSDEAARRFLTTILNFTLEGWVQATTVNTLTAVIPGIDAVTQFGELDDMLAQTLGLGRMSRRVINPLLTARVITPFQWHVNKQYRPELLSPADAIRQFMRGRWTAAQLQEELARQGWSAERIEALINGQRKFFGAADVRTLVEREQWTGVQGLQHLMDQGYDQATAEDSLRIEGIRRIDQLEASEGGAIVSAYASRAIDEAEFNRFMSAAVKNPRERALLMELGEIRRAVNVPRLSPARVRQLVLNGIASVIDFRRALEREGYPPEDVTLEELDLRAELDELRDIEKAKAEQLAAREAEKAAALEAKRRRDEAIAARQALPALNEYRRAYVRGLITRDAFANAITREKIAISPEDLAVLVADADVDRSTHLENLERRAAAAARVLDPVLPLEKFEAAVLARVLTFEQYARALVERKYDDAEQQLLTALLADRIQQREEADAQRAAAAERAEQARRTAEERALELEGRDAARARRAGVTLEAFERAVRVGIRTRDQYAAWLTSIDTSEVGRALILDLLDAQLVTDAAARTRREEADAQAKAPALTLSQRRRAVLAGVRPRAYYEQALRDAGYATDDQLVELALLDLEIAEAAAVAARSAEIAAVHEAARAAAESAAAAAAVAAAAPPPAPTLTITQLERAVTLGLLPPDALRDELVAAGTEAPDVELLVGLAVAKVPDTRVAERRWTAIAGELGTKGINLADFEKGVKAGFRTLDDYTAMLAARGYGDDDQLLLTMLLEDEIALEQLKLRTAIAARLTKMDAAPPLDEILAAVEAGELDVAEFRAVLVRFGVDTVTALLYARLVFAFGTEG